MGVSRKNAQKAQEGHQTILCATIHKSVVFLRAFSPTALESRFFRRRGHGVQIEVTEHSLVLIPLSLPYLPKGQWNGDKGIRALCVSHHFPSVAAEPCWASLRPSPQ